LFFLCHSSDEPFKEEDGTYDTYLLTKRDDHWIGVFLYDSDRTYSFEDAQSIVKRVYLNADVQ